MSGYQLAQLNIVTLLKPLDSTQPADFVASLAPINALAEQSPGFVWRLKDEEGDAMAFRGLSATAPMAPFQDRHKGATS